MPPDGAAGLRSRGSRRYGCYGFGTECRWYGKHGDSYCGKSLEGTDYGDLWGHGGSTYGARTVSLYNPTLKIAVSAGMNTDQQDDAVMNAFCLACSRRADISPTNRGDAAAAT